MSLGLFTIYRNFIMIIIIIIIIKSYITQLSMGHDQMRFTISYKERLKMNKIYKQVERFKNEIKSTISDK